MLAVMALAACAAAAAVARTRGPAPWILLGGFAAVVGVLGSHPERIVSDGIDHYVYLRSLAEDGDLDLANDFALLSPSGASPAPLTPLGRTGNLHPVGPALVWAPFYALAELVSRLRGEPADGLGPAYRNAVALASVLHGWAGVVLVYLTARRFVSSGVALLAALGIVFGTFLYWYLAYAPTMAHAPSFAAAALFAWLWLDPARRGPRRALALGACCGLAMLLRWANAVLALLPLVEALPRLRRRSEWPALAREALAFAGGAVVVFSPQMVAWRRLYGSALTIPQGEGFVAGEPALLSVLFSARHGLFSWSPLLYLGAFGLLWWLRTDRVRAAAALLTVAALARLNAGVADWWGGAAFGARRFDGVLPLFAVGMALGLAALSALVRRHPALPAAAVVGGLVLWNLLLAARYRTGAWDQAGPVSFEDMGHGAVSLVDRAIGSPFALPGALVEWARSGRRPSDFEARDTERRHARWVVRMGLDERMYLEDGWSAPRQVEGTPARALTGAAAAFVVPLHRAIDSRFGVRLAAEGTEPARVRVFVNDRPCGVLLAGSAWADVETDVPAALLRAGRNFVRLRVLDDGAEGRVVVAGAWLAPSAP
jgi:hypothetical protein